MQPKILNTPFRRAFLFIISAMILVPCVSLAIENDRLSHRVFSGPHQVLAENPTGERLVLYFDVGLSSQSYCPGSFGQAYTAQVVLENVNVATHGTVRAVTFAISSTASATVTGQVAVPAGAIVLGNLGQGLAVTWPDGLDASGQLHVLTVNFANLGCFSCTAIGEPVSIIDPPAPGPLTPFVSCQLGNTGDVVFSDLAITGETSYTCQSGPPVGVEERTWGVLKALYN